jgi:hypothetical protein
MSNAYPAVAFGNSDPDHHSVGSIGALEKRRPVVDLGRVPSQSR